MQHLTRYLPARTMVGTSLPVVSKVLVTEARDQSTLPNDTSAHKILGRTTAHGVALDFEFAGFKK